MVGWEAKYLPQTVVATQIQDDGEDCQYHLREHGAEGVLRSSEWVCFPGLEKAAEPQRSTTMPRMIMSWKQMGSMREVHHGRYSIHRLLGG